MTLQWNFFERRSPWQMSALWPVRWRCRRALVLALAGAVLEGCSSAPPRVLIALPPSLAAARLPTYGAVSARPTILLVRRLVIPEYMAAPKVRYWSGPATLAEWPDTYWAERVEIGMAREFVSDMRRRLPGWIVCDATCGDSPPELILKVEFLRFDIERGEQSVNANAHIEISGPKAAAGSPRSTLSQSFHLPIPADTAQGQARAMSDVLGVLADAAAASIEANRTMPALGTESPGMSPPEHR